MVRMAVESVAAVRDYVIKVKDAWFKDIKKMILFLKSTVVNGLKN